MTLSLSLWHYQYHHDIIIIIIILSLSSWHYHYYHDIIIIMTLSLSSWHHHYHHDIIIIIMTSSLSSWHYHYHHDIIIIIMTLSLSSRHHHHHYDISPCPCWSLVPFLSVTSSTSLGILWMFTSPDVDNSQLRSLWISVNITSAEGLTNLCFCSCRFNMKTKLFGLSLSFRLNSEDERLHWCWWPGLHCCWSQERFHSLR